MIRRFPVRIIILLVLIAALTMLAKQSRAARYLSHTSSFIGAAEPFDQAATRADQSLFEAICRASENLPPASDLSDDTEIAEGIARAQRLLPVARQRAKLELNNAAQNWPIGEYELIEANQQIDQIDSVLLDENIGHFAEVLPAPNRAVHIGPNYAADLWCDEITLMMLVHELIHVAARNNNLLIFFTAIQQQLSVQPALFCSLARAEEVACDLLGERAVRNYIDETPASLPPQSRLIAALDYNCGEDDNFDEDSDHLGQAETIRSLCLLDQPLRLAIIAQ